MSAPAAPAAPAASVFCCQADSPEDMQMERELAVRTAIRTVTALTFKVSSWMAATRNLARWAG